MNKKPFVFVVNNVTGVVTKHDLPEQFDGSLGNYLVSLAIENGYGSECDFFVGTMA